MKEPALLGKKTEDLNYQFAGLNHFNWHRATDEAGRDVTREILSHINERDGGTPVNIYCAPFPEELVQSLDVIPCGYHRYYYMQKDMLDHLLQEFSSGVTRAEQMWKVEQDLFNLYRDPNLTGKPEALEKRGGAYYSDAACECINAIANNKRMRMVVNTENRGAISCLAGDDIVEVSAIISSAGAEPIAWGDMKPLERGQLQLMKAMEQTAIEAALTGNYGLALEAFILNPLIESGADAKQILDELLVAHEKYLPQFQDAIDRLKKQGVMPQDKVVLELMAKGY
jgi:6-phospho-beta-glucosidase